jgi:hypothetical protein
MMASSRTTLRWLLVAMPVTAPPPELLAHAGSCTQQQAHLRAQSSTWISQKRR